MIIFLAAVFFALAAGPAAADPVTAAIVGFVKTVAAWKIGTFAIGSFLLKTAAMFTVSVLTRAKMSKAGQQGGIREPSTTAGEETSGSLILGKYATGGSMVCPPMTDGHTSKTPNIHLTYVIELSDLPVAGLDGIWIGDEKVKLAPAGLSRSELRDLLDFDPEFKDFRHEVARLNDATDTFPDMQPAVGKFLGRAWFKFFDGTQTEAYQGLIDTDGNGRPWLSDMIGRGIPFVVCRFRFERDLYQGLPQCVFEVTGIGLYDPRKDSSVGGSGPHRWGVPSTYEPSENMAVQVYNILRGIELPDGSRWGGEAEAEDLPLDNWFAEMNKCDEGDGWRSSYEIKIGPEALGGDTPMEVIEVLMRGASGQIAEAGGVWRIRVGGPGLPVAAFTDDDLVNSEGSQFRPFKALQETYNGIQAQAPEPLERWASKEAPPRYNAAWEAEDGGRRLVTSLQLPATPYSDQVQRVMEAYINDTRRDRVLDVPLPPDFAAVEVLDSVAFTSEENGFLNKVFEVTGGNEDLLTLIHQLTLRERDSGDYVWTPGMRLPTSISNPTTIAPLPREVIDFRVEPSSVPGRDGRPRSAAILLIWNPEQSDARGISYRIRKAGASTDVGGGSISMMSEGLHKHSEGIGNLTDYEVSAVLVSDRATVWTGWLPVRTGDFRLGADDLWVEEITADILEDVEEAREFARGAGAYLRSMRIELENVRDVLAGINLESFSQRRSLERGIALEIGNARTEFYENVEIALSETAAVGKSVEVLTGSIAGRVATVLEEKGFLIEGDNVLATQLEAVEATLGLGDYAGAESSLLARVDKTEDGISAQGQSIDTVQATLGLGDYAGAETSLLSRVDKTEEGISAQGQKVDTVEATLGLGDYAGGTSTLISRVKKTEDGIDAQSEQIDTVEATLGVGNHAGSSSGLVAKVTQQGETIESNADAINVVEARVGRSWAAGTFRVRATATGTGAVTRLALLAEAGMDTDAQNAGLYLIARTNGQNSVAVQADRFAVVQDGLPGEVGTVPFFIQDGQTFIKKAIIGEAAIDTLRIADGSVVIYWAANSETITIQTSYAARILILTNAKVRGSSSGFAINYFLYLNDVEIDTTVFSVSDYTWNFTSFKVLNVPAGTHVIRHEYTENGHLVENERTAVWGAYR